MSDKAIEQLIDVVGMMVRQNDEVLKQNREIIEMYRDNSDKEHALRLQTIALREQETLRAKADVERSAEDQKTFDDALETLGIGRGDVAVLQILRDLGIYEGEDGIKAKLKAKVRAELESKKGV